MNWDDKTKEEWERLSKHIRYGLVMKHLKLGDAVNQEILDAVKHWYGDVFEKLPDPETIATIHFDSLGQPHTLNDDIIKIVRTQDDDKT